MYISRRLRGPGLRSSQAADRGRRLHAGAPGQPLRELGEAVLVTAFVVALYIYIYYIDRNTYIYIYIHVYIYIYIHISRERERL